MVNKACYWMYIRSATDCCSWQQSLMAAEMQSLSSRGVVRRRDWRAMLAESPVALSFPGCLIAAQQKWLRATQVCLLAPWASMCF